MLLPAPGPMRSQPAYMRLDALEALDLGDASGAEQRKDRLAEGQRGRNGGQRAASPAI